MTPLENAFLNHLRVVNPSGFRDHGGSGLRTDENVLDEYRPDQLADWKVAARWGAEHQDTPPEDLLTTTEQPKPRTDHWRKSVLFIGDSTWELEQSLARIAPAKEDE